MSHHRNPGGCVKELTDALEEIERGDIAARLREAILKSKTFKTQGLDVFMLCSAAINYSHMIACTQCLRSIYCRVSTLPYPNQMSLMFMQPL